MEEIKVETKRTRCRLINMSDLKSIHNLHALPESDEYNTLGIPENIEQTKSIIEPWVVDNNLDDKSNYTFAIETKSDDGFVGLFGLKLGRKKYKKAEVWYVLYPKYWNQGFATEVLSAMIDFGFDKLKLHRIQAGCAVDNVGSIKVLEKVGMIREGRGRQILPLRSGWSDNFAYSILESDTRKESAS
jgi:RimJ/RimL family protein N-acetyltransferase